MKKNYTFIVFSLVTFAIILAGCKSIKPVSDFQTSLSPHQQRVLTESLKIKNVNSQDYPIIELDFSLFDNQSLPVIDLNIDQALINAPMKVLDNPAWGNEIPLPLTSYFTGAKTDKPLVYFLRNLPPPDNICAGRILFLVNTEKKENLQQIDKQTKEILDSWIRNLSPNTYIRFANFSSSSSVELETLWLSHWSKEKTELKSVLDDLTPVDDRLKIKTNAVDFNSTMRNAITELNTTDCDGPKWLVLINTTQEQLKLHLGKDIGRALSEQKIKLFVQVLESDRTNEANDLKTAAEYSGGKVIPPEEKEYMRALVKKFTRLASGFNKNWYRLSFFDADFNQGGQKREYRLSIQRQELKLSKAFIVNTNAIQLAQCRKNEIDHAIQKLQLLNNSQVHAMISTLMTRYSLTDLSDFFGKVHDHAMKGHVTEGMEFLKRLDKIFGKDQVWKDRFQKDYERLGDVVAKQGDTHKAITLYHKSNSYRPTQGVYEKLLNYQLSILDFLSAQKSAEWLFNNGNISNKNMRFVYDMANAYGSGLKFSMSEKLIRRFLMNTPKNDDIWGYSRLLAKGTWYGGIAKAIHFGMPYVKHQPGFMSLIKNVSAEKDIHWIGYVAAKGDHGGNIIFSSHPKHINSNISEIFPILKSIPFLSINQPIFLDYKANHTQIGLILVPDQRGNGIIVLSYDDQLELSEKQLFDSIVAKPEKDELWHQFKKAIAYRCGTSMTKTIGLLFQNMDLPVNNWVDNIVEITKQLYPDEIAVYSIITGRKKATEEIRPLYYISHLANKKLPSRIIMDEKANSNPFFLLMDRTFDNKQVYEFTTAIYSGSRWLGVQRIGYHP